MVWAGVGRAGELQVVARVRRSARRRAEGVREAAPTLEARTTARFGVALEQLVGRDVQRVREALQLVGGEAPPACLDAAHGGLVDADPPGEGPLAPALPLAQARDLCADPRLMFVAHRFRHLRLATLCITVRHPMPGFLHRLTQTGLADDVIIAS